MYARNAQALAACRNCVAMLRVLRNNRRALLKKPAKGKIFTKIDYSYLEALDGYSIEAAVVTQDLVCGSKSTATSV